MILLGVMPAKGNFYSFKINASAIKEALMKMEFVNHAKSNIVQTVHYHTKFVKPAKINLYRPILSVFVNKDILHMKTHVLLAEFLVVCIAQHLLT